jgi:hypothetical protein
LFGEIIAGAYQNHTKYANIWRGKNADKVNIEANDKQSEHCVLIGQ